MTPEERVYTAISGGIPDRVPFFPKIWVDLASRLTGKGLLQIIADPADAERICVPTMNDFKDFGWEKRQKEIMDKNTKKLSIAGDLHSATLAFYVELRGMDRAMFDLLEFPELVHAVMEKGALIAVERGKFNIDIGIKVLRLNDSAGNILPVAEDLVKTGLDCIGPLDPLGGFKPEDIRKRVGDAEECSA